MAPVPSGPAGPPHGKTQVIGLDLLRFLAAAAVMLFHLAGTSWLIPSSEAMMLLNGAARFPELLGLAAIGWIGVPIFFTISGFVIAYSAEGASAERFLRARVLRLLPGVWICASVSFGLGLIALPVAGTDLVLAYLRTLVLFPIPTWIDGVYWTLGIEIMFYALVFALLLTGGRDRLEATMIAVGLTSAAIWIAASTPFFPGLDVLASKRIAKLLLVTHGCDFALGVMIWLIAFHGFRPGRVATAGVCLVGSLLQIGYDARFARVELRLTELPVSPQAVFLAALALLVACLVFDRRLHTLLGATGARAARAVGLATYPLYLLHTFVGILAMRVSLDLGVPPLAALLVGVAVAVGVSLLVALRAEPAIRAPLARILDQGLDRLFRSRRGVGLSPASRPR